MDKDDDLKGLFGQEDKEDNSGGAVEKMLELLASLVNSTECADNEMVGKLYRQLYTKVIGKYRPLIKGLPAVSKEVSEDLTPLIVTILEILNDIQNNEDYQVAVKINRKIRARERKALLDIHVLAGFSKKEAMAFVLQDSAKNNVSQYQQLAELPRTIKNKK
jgi:hypothetical protein